MYAKYNLILEILGDQELLGAEIAERSNGQLRRRTVFVFLGRMQELGMVTSRPEPDVPPGVIPRSLFRRAQGPAEGTQG
jgi:hypothetical protein